MKIELTTEWGRVTIELNGDELSHPTRDELVEAFQQCLYGAGYRFYGNLEFVQDDEDEISSE